MRGDLFIILPVFAVVAGLWPAGTHATDCRFLDLTDDGIVGEADLEALLSCVTGPSQGPPAAGCEPSDADRDGDVDQADFGMLQECIGSSFSPASPVISEFMALNHSGIKDNFGEDSDWIEIYNPRATPLNLKDWCLTDNPNRPDKWRFPEVILAPRSYLLVYASNRNLTDPAQPLHTNFRLEGDGEYLALISPDLVSSRHAYAPQFPLQVEDVSYGLATDRLAHEFVPVPAACSVLIPPDESLGLSWTGQFFSDASWTHGTTGVGYERLTGYESLIGTDVSAMYGTSTSVYIRIPFFVDDPGLYDGMFLYMHYDDGFVAYLNGEPVLSRNAPAQPNWSSGATAAHEAPSSETFWLADQVGLLRRGLNMLAIHGLNVGHDSRFVMRPRLVGSVPATVLEPPTERYFLTPTPGRINTRGSAGVGPLFAEVGHAPLVPADHEDLTITARPVKTFNNVQSMELTYRVMYAPAVTLPMTDDGTGADAQAGDGVYTAVIPASAYTAGQMVRYAFLASDTQGVTTRWPLFTDALNSPEYFGTMVDDPRVSSALPVLHWFVQTPAAADTTSGTRCSLFYNGEFYDNVQSRIRGQTSAGWRKHHYKFDFNSGYHFRCDPLMPRVEEANVNSTYSDKAYIRQVLAAETYRDAGGAYSASFPLRVQQNGEFFSVAVFVEQPDEDYLERNGLDPHGALYKMYNSLNSTSNAEKKTRRSESVADLQALISGLNLSGSQARARFLFDNVDLPGCINYIAATTIMHDNDHVGKNYYMYRDSEGNREWVFLPWDKDLTFGRNFDGAVLNDQIWADVDAYGGNSTLAPSHPRFGDSDHQKVDWAYNLLIDRLHDTQNIRAMYVRRLRTLMDELLQPPGTPASQLRYEARVDELVAMMTPDVLLDRAKWGNPYGQNQSFNTAIGQLKNQYLAVRRTHLFNTHSSAPGGIIPGPQPIHPLIQFGTVEHSPASGIQDQEYIQLVNSNSYAVDLSGWKLQVNGDTKHTFRPGTVMRASSSMYVSPNVVAFRSRPSGPSGNQSLFVQGNYRNHLVPGEVLTLLDQTGYVIATLTINP